MNGVHGELPYIGRDLHKIVFPTEHVFPEHVYFLYYANDEKFTRIVEYKQFTHHKSPIFGVRPAKSMQPRLKNVIRPSASVV